jgi:hypothetical protein
VKDASQEAETLHGGLPMGHTHLLRHLGPGVKAILINFCDEKWGERHYGKPRERARKSERRESGGRNTSQGPSYGSHHTHLLRHFGLALARLAHQSLCL